MLLSETIVQKYPISISYAVAASQSVYLEVDETVDAVDRLALEAVLREEMGVILEKSAGYRVFSVQLGAVEMGGVPFLRIQYGQWACYVDAHNIVRDAPWVIRALADQAQWLKECDGKVIEIRPYSARQQLLALKIKRECQQQMDMDSDVAEASRQAVAAIQSMMAKRMEDRFPKFSDRPIQESAWDMINSSNNLLAKSKRMSLAELAAVLYGKLDLEQEMDSWIAFFCALPVFVEEVNRTKNKICNIVREECCLANGDSFFSALRSELKHEKGNADKDMEILRDIMEQEVEVRKLRPETLASLFSQVTLNMNRQIQQRLEDKVIQRIVDESEKLLKTELTNCRVQIQSFNREMAAFCPLKGVWCEEEPEYNWHELADVRNLNLTSSVPGWDRPQFNDLVMNAPDRHYLHVWLMRRDMISQVDPGAYEDIQPTDLSSGDTAVAVYRMPLPVQ